MTFLELKELSYNMIDETDLDEQVEIIVANAINKSYADLCRKDVRLTRVYIPIINGVATLPSNFIRLEKVIPELSSNDKRVGNVITTDKTGSFEILYAYQREMLVEDSDEPDLHEMLQRCLSYYACHKYFAYRKKVELSKMFLEDYNADIFGFLDEVENNINASVEVIKDIW